MFLNTFKNIFYKTINIRIIKLAYADEFFYFMIVISVRSRVRRVLHNVIMRGLRNKMYFVFFSPEYYIIFHQTGQTSDEIKKLQK